ncbi:SirB2 family protein [Oleiagrimonas sp. C23AA]|uniref:SirB2 family protein n=1 Tax=Oleiagrimonas sp. C23AA TaxID=2719047 RepID=UPI001423CBD9|nr:SirB2 family protein [Oleiagrimonas sp. C23AA]NII11849.1 SirB2 family protein [Oleiagrimonas sp. C23AA]
MAAFFPQILWLHIGCVIASGSLFFTRGTMMLAGSPMANHRAWRYLSYVIDTMLLVAALLLVWIIHQYPFVQAWLTVKVVMLVIYIVLGVFALRRGRTRAQRAVFFVAAIAVFLFIVSVARTQSPLGFLGAWF